MQLTNPLPGMNPVFEISWNDFRVSMLVGIADALNQVLPDDFASRIDEEEAPLEPCDDLGTQELVRRDVGSTLAAGACGSSGYSRPKAITMDPPMRRWIKILDIDDRIVTVIEFLCPSDKRRIGRQFYLQKQRDWLLAGVNLVEIDLLRVGEPTCSPELAAELKPTQGTRYLVIVTRAQQPSRPEIYDCPLRAPLPTVQVPLRPSDLDVPVVLQPLVDRAYSTGRYWQRSHRDVTAPALPPEDAAWVEERLQLAGLKDCV